jgi:hypothetical protein
MSTIFIKKCNYSGTKTRRPARRSPAVLRAGMASGEDGYKSSNGVFSLMSLRLINFNPD